MSVFAAIDFETADHGRDSACAVGVIVVEGRRIIERYYQLIRPPRREFMFTCIHGLTWDTVRDSPTFGEMWPDVDALIEPAEFLVAHNAPFDRSVLHSCCSAAGFRPPEHEFVCTVKLARATWRLPSARLPVVCQHLGIPLNHHDALSDAEACALIAIRALGRAANH